MVKLFLSRSISLDNKEQIRKFISEAAIQYDDVSKKNKEFKKHEKFLAEKIITSNLGIKKTVMDWVFVASYELTNSTCTYDIQ